MDRFRRIAGGKCRVLLGAVLLAGCVSAANRPLQFVAGSAPDYPEAARRKGIEGFVVVRYDVTVEGRVSGASVVRSEPADVFDTAALAAVQSWVFNPALVDGQPQPERGRVSTVTFKLDNGDKYADY